MEEIKKIEVSGQQYGVADMLMRGVMGGNAQVIEWSHTHNMNDYKDTGTYRIKGERTGNPMSDNLPIMNQGSDHTIDGILYVLDSSLANGSGNSDDCTVTQFLMLSNRVGGQEGDMYMRSAYGSNKDSLIWKPWEKYQTNTEVGAVNNAYTLNPSNPTQAIGYVGMNDFTDNGIYSGIYFPPKSMIGTPNESAVIQDATAIETFVMVVINNYAAAGDYKTITQIKFAVTNGGVFSMEQRSTAIGETYFSQWESVGGGGSDLPITIDIDGAKIDGNGCEIYLGSSVCIGADYGNMSETPTMVIGTNGSTIKIGNRTLIGMGESIHTNNIVAIGTDGYVEICGNVRIGNNIKMSWDDSANTLTFGTEEDSSNNNIFGKHVLIGKNVCLGTVVPESSVEYKFAIYAEDDKMIFKYNGKTAELPLT